MKRRKHSSYKSERCTWINPTGCLKCINGTNLLRNRHTLPLYRPYEWITKVLLFSIFISISIKLPTLNYEVLLLIMHDGFFLCNEWNYGRDTIFPVMKLVECKLWPFECFSSCMHRLMNAWKKDFVNSKASIFYYGNKKNTNKLLIYFAYTMNSGYTSYGIGESGNSNPGNTISNSFTYRMVKLIESLISNDSVLFPNLSIHSYRFNFDQFGSFIIFRLFLFQLERSEVAFFIFTNGSTLR